jgi:hypothetical protein
MLLFLQLLILISILLILAYIRVNFLIEVNNIALSHILESVTGLEPSNNTRIIRISNLTESKAYYVYKILDDFGYLANIHNINDIGNTWEVYTNAQKIFTITPKWHMINDIHESQIQHQIKDYFHEINQYAETRYLGNHAVGKLIYQTFVNPNVFEVYLDANEVTICEIVAVGFIGLKGPRIDGSSVTICDRYGLDDDIVSIHINHNFTQMKLESKDGKISYTWLTNTRPTPKHRISGPFKCIYDVHVNK